MPRWLILTVFLVIEIILVLVMRGDWQYRTGIRKAKSAMAEERWDDALNYWAKHAARYPGALQAPPFLRDRALARYGAGQYEGTLEDINTLFQLDSTLERDPDLLELLAKTQDALGRPEDARETYRKLLAVQPYNAPANLYLGRYFLDQGNILEAARYFQSIPVEKYPEDLRQEWNRIEERFVREAESQESAAPTSPTTVSESPDTAPDAPATPAP
jgi:tetratricopeptide (TPR) repeat protein